MLLILFACHIFGDSASMMMTTVLALVSDSHAYSCILHLCINVLMENYLLYLSEGVVYLVFV